MSTRSAVCARRDRGPPRPPIIRAVALLLNGECRIGGYQVLKKWLSYRDHSITGRPLAAEEVGHLQQTARRIAAILLLGSDLDSSYRACAAEHRLLSLSENNLV